MQTANLNSGLILSCSSADEAIKHAHILEAAYPENWKRENIDARVQLYQYALNSLRTFEALPLIFSISTDQGDDQPVDLPLSHGSDIGSRKRHQIELHPLGAVYHFSMDKPGLMLDENTLAIHYPSNVKVDLTDPPRLSNDEIPSILPHPDTRQTCLIGLSQAYADFYEHTGDLIDLNRQLVCATFALVSPSLLRCKALLFVGSALRIRYTQLSDDIDLRVAVSALRHANQIARYDVDVPVLLYELGLALQFNYRLYGDLSDLKSCTTHLNDALKLATNKHPIYCRLARVLSGAYKNSFQKFGDPDDMDKHSCLINEAFDVCYPDHIYRAEILFAVSGFHLYAYQESKNEGHIDTARQQLYEALLLCPSRNLYFLSSLKSQLCYILWLLFQSRGNNADLDEAILAGRQALELGPRWTHGSTLINLGLALNYRFKEKGEIGDLEESISSDRRTLDILRPGHPHRYVVTENLGIKLSERYNLTWIPEDLEEALDLYRETATMVPHGHYRWAYLQVQMAEALLLRYRRYTGVADLFMALQLTKEALSRSTESDSLSGWDRARGIFSSTVILLALFDNLGDVEHLNTAVSLQTEALQSISLADCRRPEALYHLAMVYERRSRKLNSNSDGQMSYKLLRNALDITPPGHYFRAHILFGLSRMFLLETLPQNSIEIALRRYIDAITDVQCLPQTRFEQGVTVLRLMREKTNTEGVGRFLSDQMFLAHRLTVELLPQLAYFGLNAHARFHILAQAPGLAADAAACAIQVPQVHHAIELLESGRAVFWTQVARLRSSVAHLPADIAKEISNIARELESQATAASNILWKDTKPDTVQTLEEQYSRTRQLSQKFNALLASVRSMPGLERFMLNDTYSALSRVAQEFPVAVLLATSHFCGALLIRDPLSAVEIVRFNSGINLTNLTILIGMLQNTKRHARGTASTRALKKRFDIETQRNGVLPKVWHQVMLPLVHALGYNKRQGRSRPRLLLCATGQFSHIPLHAAGTDDERCSDYFITSYTPTLGAIIASRESFSVARRRGVQAVLAAVPCPFKWSRLDQTVVEVYALRGILPSTITKLIPAKPNMAAGAAGSASSSEVLASLPDATILHMACHGYHDTVNPLSSGFVMGDAMLTVSQLMKLHLPNAFFAFLSACETARAAKDQPDQAVHLAATMLFVGFKSVIGTMWSMGDMDGPIVAKHVYAELFKGESEHLDVEAIPYALADATDEMRKQRLHPSRWAPYVHFGM